VLWRQIRHFAGQAVNQKGETVSLPVDPRSAKSAATMIT
jgi:hypothetical protein